MPRPHIEFLHTRHLPWTRSPVAGVAWKVLSEDDDSGALSVLLRIDTKHHAVWPRAEVDWELFVLTGRLTINTTLFTEHCYAYLDLRHGSTALVPVGESPVTLLCFFSGAPTGTLPTRALGPAIACLDTLTLPWDSSGMDPNINHLNAARKNLRLADDGRCRSYLLGGMPQGFPSSPMPLETHPHVEEFFMVSGDIAFHAGIMRTGAYFWRPPGIAHGRDCTRSGFLLFCRTPGSNVTTSHWSRERYSASYRPAHRPALPPALADCATAVDAVDDY